MPVMLVYDHIIAEIRLIRDQMSIVCKVEEDIDFRGVTTLQELILRVNELDEISVGCMDFEADGETALQIIRDRDSSVLPVIIADSKTSPLTYVRPSIMAAGLLLRPLSEQQVSTMLREIISAVWAKERERLFNKEVFTFSTRDGVIRIPYSQILYFEARNKKIVVCTSRAETEFYSTLENLSNEIPTYFLRCHKGFIVNKLLVERADLKQNLLHLINGFQVPISRSYKTTVKEAMA